MTWRRQSTSASVDVELSDFEPEQLLQGLIDAGWISAEEATATKRRAETQKKDFSQPVFGGFQAGDELDRAMIALRRNNRTDALYYIEKHLGREWMGLLQ